METKQAEKLQEAIDLMRNDPDIIAYVEHVEKSIPTTKGHYGEYMRLITGYNKNGRVYAFVIAEALKQAGADQYGVNWAYKIVTGSEIGTLI